jgi:hypothetical protein
MAKNKYGIRHVRIEPADDGGFMTEVCKYPPEKKKGEKNAAIPMDYESGIEKHVHTNGKELGKFIEDLFPPSSASRKKGESKSVSDGGSRIDTYEGSGEEEEE